MKNIKRFLALLLVVVSIGAICLQAAPVVKAATTLYWPVPGHTELFRGFSDRHEALDINDSSINGSMVVAAMSGKISVMTKCAENHYGSYGDCNGGGTCVIIYGDDGRTYSYAHMQAGSIPSNYKVGTYITAGTQIGRVGSTGNSSGPHLHFSIAKSENYWENLVNPSLETYIYSALYWPVPGHTKLSRGFSDSHEALDINDSSINGVKVIAAMSGKISVMTKCTENHYGSYGDCNGGGTCVIIYGDDGRTYSYAHMQAGSIPSNYKVGTYITAGTQIGRVGSTGNSSGPHLHFSIAKSKNYWENLVNPSLENYYHIAGDLCYFTDLPDRMSASNNDAVIAQKLYKLQGATPTKYGAKLYDRWGRQLGSVSDSITGYVDNTYIEMWWTVSTAFKVKLWPGQTYQFDFWATVDGTTYTSPRRTFTTTGTAPTVKVNYNANGGSGAMPATTASVGGTLTLAANQFTRTGYKFAGWNVLRGDGKWYVSGQGWATESQIESGKSKYVYTDKQSMTFSTIWYLNLSTLYDYTFYAIWEKNPNASTYTLTYDANGGSGAPGSQTKTQDQTLTLSITKPTRTGYTFQGWATSASATTAAYQPGGSFTGNANTTLYAVWKANTYTLTYDANGGSGAPGSQTKTHDQTLTLSTTKPTRTGYTFQGWATSATATTAKYQPGDRFTGNANNTLYAVWKANTYTLTYDANGGSGAPGSQTKTHGHTLTLSSTKPTRTGYTFQGWATSASATTAAYQPGGSFTGNANTTLYAVWKANTYTLTYDANGGSGAPGSMTKTYGVALYLSTTKPTRTGYTFQGWATSATATTAKYQPGDRFTGNANNTLYAVWKANTYTLTYDANGGSGAPGSQTKTHDKTLTLSTTKPTRTGYTFLGWATSATATTAKYQPGDRFTGNANTILYAVWEKNPVTNNCETNGHSYKVTFTAPSCEEKGYSTYTCTVCGHSYQADEVAAFGHHYSNGTCTTCGKINTAFTGIANRDGALYYIQDDKIATDVTGLIKYDGIWYYVKSGKVASETTDLVKYNGEWFYVVKGKVASGMTDLVNWGGEWFYVVKGKLAANTTTLIKWNGAWYYIYKGKLAGNTTNLIKYNGEWWYVIKGRVASEITDLVKYNGEWFYVVKGKIASNTTKLVEFNGGWYYIYKGKLAAKTTTLVKHNGSWYYVVNGKVNFNYNGKVLYSGTYYKVKNGKVV